MKAGIAILAPLLLGLLQKQRSGRVGPSGPARPFEAQSTHRNPGCHAAAPAGDMCEFLRMITENLRCAPHFTRSYVVRVFLLQQADVFSSRRNR